MASDLRRAIRDVVVVLVLFALAGLLAGWVWHALWAPAPVAEGANVVGQPVFPADTDFRGTGLYAVIAACLGFVLGAVCALVLDRDEVVTLGAVLVGSFVAAWLMFWVGHGLGPADPPDEVTRPEQLAGLRDSLRAASTVVWTVLPATAVAGFFAVLAVVIKRAPADTRPGPDPAG